MLEQLRMLVELQAVDKTLYRLEQDHIQIPERTEQLLQEETGLKEAFEKVKAELETVSKRRSELDKELESVKARQRKAENRLMGAKTQREYRAANAEIDEAKDSIKSQEEILLDLMERQEALEIEVTKQAERLDEFKARAKTERTELTKRHNAVASEMDKLNKQRGGLLKGVEPSLLGQYDFIRKSRQGVALAPVRTGTCLACNMDIPPQQFNELQRMDRVMSCPSCQRLLYWADAEGFADEEE